MKQFYHCLKNYFLFFLDLLSTIERMISATATIAKTMKIIGFLVSPVFGLITAIKAVRAFIILNADIVLPPYIYLYVGNEMINILFI